MKQKLWLFIKSFNNCRKFLFPIILTIIGLYLAFINHVSGTILSGWDTLHPEFNFPLSFQRLIFGVFRSEQGVGAVAAHAHMSDLPRVILLWLTSFVIPENILRYSFFSACLLVGVLGVFYFVKYILKDQESKEYFALLGGLFYLLNLGTLQHFYVPFEMFATQYATLPWIFLFASKYLNTKKKKFLSIFALVSLLGTPMAYAPTLWYAFFICFLTFLLLFIKTNFKEVITLITVSLIINSFWLLPNLYFLFSGNAALVPQARINKIFSEEAFINNKNYGNILDAAILKNFLFDWTAYKGDDKFDFLMANWRIHLNNPLVLIIGYLNFFIICLGIIYSYFKKNIFSKALLFSTLVSLIFIINLNPPFEFIFKFLRENSSLFKEALRFPFTKFSIILIFGFSLFFAYGQIFIYQILRRLFNKKIVTIQTAVTFIFLIVFMLPAFKGDFISKYMQVKIPDEYFEMFNWFNKESNSGRVANLPIHSFWGWIYYNWGFQGAQFISFGIKQPLMDRDYDRWNPSNEQYYREMSYAIYSQDSKLLLSVLDKYQIKYLILDKNVLAPGNKDGKKALFFPEIELVLQNTEGKIKLVKNFKNIYIYEYENNFYNKNFSLGNYNILAKPNGSYDIDLAYLNRTYINNFNGINSNYNMPFLSFSDNQNKLNEDLVSEDNGKLKINLKGINKSFSITPIDYFYRESLIPANLYLKKDNSTFWIKIILKVPEGAGNQPPELEYQVNTKDFDLINIDDTQTIEVKDVGANYLYQGSIYLSTKQFVNLAFYKSKKPSRVKKETLNEPIELCDTKRADQVISLEVVNDSVKILAKNSNACIKIPVNEIVGEENLILFKDLIHISFTTDSRSSSPAMYCIFDKLLSRCIKEQRGIRNNYSVNEYITLTEGGNLYLVLNLDATNNNKTQDISYKEISFTKISPSQIISISPEEILDVLNTKKINISQQNIVSIDNSKSQNYMDFSKLNINYDFTNCNNLEPRSALRIFRPQGVIEYSSIQGSSCDYFPFPNLPHAYGYLVALDTKNKEGLPLRVCVANVTTKRCDLYVSVPKNKEFKTDYWVIPPTFDGGVGYNIHIDNYSVGKTATTNSIKNLRVIPIPYNWLTNIAFKQEAEKGSFPLKINEVFEVIPNFYKVNLSNSGLLVLDKSFEKGWIMIDSNAHVKVNDWANGWIVDKEQRNKNYYIFYLPQILEFLGFILMVPLLIYLIRKN